MKVVRRGVCTWSSSKSGDVHPIRDAEDMTEVGPFFSSESDGVVPPDLIEAAQPSSLLRRASRPTVHPVAFAPRPSVVQRGVVYDIFHETVYDYEEPVERSTHAFRLQPVHDLTQSLLEFDLEVSPGGRNLAFEDVFGNQSVRYKIEAPYEQFRATARSRVRIKPQPHIRGIRSANIPLVWMPWQRQMMQPYLLPPELPESQLRELSNFAMSFAERQDHDLVATLTDMNETIYRDFKYVQGVTSLRTSPFDVFVAREGVCQDFANLFNCLARLMGIPARYRVGYIHTGSNYDNQLQSEASHAWSEVYLPRVGWRGFDPTNGCVADTDHIRVATGRNYRDATPTGGTLYKGGSGETLQVTVRVEVVDEV